MTIQEWGARWVVSPAAMAELAALLDEPTRVVPQEPKPGREAEVQRDLRLAAPYLRCLLWRNNVGVLKDARGVPVRYGLCNESSRVNARVKSSDIVGITPAGKFLAVEVKAPGWTYAHTPREEAQLRFINLVRARGGVGFFATSVEDLEKGLDG